MNGETSDTTLCFYYLPMQLVVRQQSIWTLMSNGSSSNGWLRAADQVEGKSLLPLGRSRKNTATAAIELVPGPHIGVIMSHHYHRHHPPYRTFTAIPTTPLLLQTATDLGADTDVMVFLTRAKSDAESGHILLPSRRLKLLLALVEEVVDSA